MSLRRRIGVRLTGLDRARAERGQALSVDWVAQEQTQWCWAACLQMVTTASGRPASQCRLAEQAFGVAGCCADGATRRCNRPLSLTGIGKEWTRSGYTCEHITGKVSLIDLRAEFDAGHAVEVGLRWRRGGGHPYSWSGAIGKGKAIPAHSTSSYSTRNARSSRFRIANSSPPTGWARGAGPGGGC